MSLTIKENISTEIVVKKSKFIANLFYIRSEEEAEEKIKEIKKKYYDARHNCYAYTIMTEDGIISRSSDDGEPSGTAGMPMLNVIVKKELVNVLVIVTRYFGGILLGTGGLVKAYTDALQEALEKTEFVHEEIGYEMEINLEYPEFEKFQYYCRKNNINIINSDYGENIKCLIEVTKEEKEKINSINEKDSIKVKETKILREKNIRKNVDI